MKPGEHEYKIMGMSPYVSDEYSENVFKILLNNYFSLDRTGLKFINKASHGSSLLKRLRKNFTGYRFDNICAGLQRHFEYVVIEWVKNWAKDTKIKKAVFAGGCFMNVKTNKLILELDIFDKIFFMPSCGDESISIGAAYKIFEEDEVYQSPLNSLCKGQSFSDRDVERTLEKYPDSLLIKKCNDIEREIVSKLIDYKIVGRFKGKEEFGARALGNRSILCRPDDLKIIHKLNKSIKMRDFWMPFAASIIEENMDRYIINPKGIPAPI
jgi:carbamoyltransferase